MKYHEIKEITRKLRKNPTKSEERLWHYLRRKQLNGKQFLRQHPIIYDRVGDELFFYVPDFYCPSSKLAIELDGEIHKFQMTKDKVRDERISALGITVIRFWNTELYEIEKVLTKIKECLV